MRRQYGPGFDQPVMREDSVGTVSWYLTDRQGSVRNVLDGAGAVAGTLAYDGYGVRTADSGDTDRFGYTGREWDDTTGLQFNRDRVYDPVLGRWYSTDPSGFAAGDVNLYRYVSNGPTNATDPSGREDRAVQEGSDIYWEHRASSPDIWILSTPPRTRIGTAVRAGVVELDAGWLGRKVEVPGGELAKWPTDKATSSLSQADREAVIRGTLSSMVAAWEQKVEAAAARERTLTRKEQDGVAAVMKPYVVDVRIQLGVHDGSLKSQCEAQESYRQQVVEASLRQLARQIAEKEQALVKAKLNVAVRANEEREIGWRKAAVDTAYRLGMMELGNELMAGVVGSVAGAYTTGAGMNATVQAHRPIGPVATFVRPSGYVTRFSGDGLSMTMTPRLPGGTLASVLAEPVPGMSITIDSLSVEIQARLQAAGARPSLYGDLTTPGRIEYGTIDPATGNRSGTRARVTPDMILSGTEANRSIRPPGFISGLPPLRHARGHLHGNQLGGSGDLPENLVTIWQNPVNVPGMTNVERQVRLAVEAGEVVYYYSTPLYQNGPGMPSHVRIRARGSGGFRLDEVIENIR